MIKDEHLKLSKRFQEFVVGHIGDNFCDYNEKRKIVEKEEFQIALVNAYRVEGFVETFVHYQNKISPMMM